VLIIIIQILNRLRRSIMALLENAVEVLEDNVPTVLLGVGTILLAPFLLPTLRPLTKTVVKSGLLVGGKARELVSEAGEQLSDIVAEARAEMAVGAAGTTATGGRAERAARKVARPAKSAKVARPAKSDKKAATVAANKGKKAE
jgi:Protein of unknown function (DUF5132)